MVTVESCRYREGEDHMNMDDYQAAAKATGVFPQEVALEYLTLGLVGEAGEIANKVKKILRGDHEFDEGAKDNLRYELGDVLWYVAVLADHLEVDLSDLAVRNLNKLKARKQSGTLLGSGDNR